MSTNNLEKFHFYKTENELFGKENTLLKREIELEKRGGKVR